MEKLTINQYQEGALRTMKPIDDKSMELLNGVMGLNGEAGECIDLMKKHFFQGHDLNKEKMVEELGDVAWYLAVSAHALGMTLEEILQMNLDKLRARYPEGFDAERSIHRNN